MIWRAIAPLLFALPLKWNYIWYSNYKLNVLYTLALGMFVIYCYEEMIVKHNLKWYEHILLLVTLLVGLRTIGTYSDYGFLGIFLIFGLHFTREKRFVQASIIAAIEIYFYGVQYNNWSSAWGS